MNKNTAILTGITGQIGSYVCELLLNKGYEVHGLIRRSSSLNTQRIDHLYNNPKLKLFYGDLNDYSSIANKVNEIKPELMFNLAAQSHVRVSFDIPEYTFDTVGTSVIRCLEAVRQYSPETRILTASSSEMFGSSPPPQSEVTTFHPRSPYAVAKVAGFHAVVNYRESYGLFACNAISFNTESPKRGSTFFTKKIVEGACRIKLGLQDVIRCGNLKFLRDWQHAKDTSEAMFAIITANEADDFVIGSGVSHSGQEFIELVFGKLGLDWTQHIQFDPRYVRPAEVDALQADPTKIKTKLGWQPKISFEDLVDEMIEQDMKMAHQEKLIKDSNK